jgi:prepilin-type N-terminal cleavage/methylation domain-containing protein
VNCTKRKGATLVELVVVIAVLAILASMVTLGIRRLEVAPDDLPTALANARRHAAASGTAVHVSRVERDTAVDFTVFPDGHVVSDSAAQIDLLTGRIATRNSAQ